MNTYPQEVMGEIVATEFHMKIKVKKNKAALSLSKGPTVRIYLLSIICAALTPEPPLPRDRWTHRAGPTVTLRCVSHQIIPQN